MKYTKHLIALTAGIILGLLGFVSTGISASRDSDHVTICHATGSASNPFVQISPSASGVFNGHLGKSHQDGRDIIPPFEYKGTTYSQNWDSTGQAIFNNGCKVPTGTTTTTPTTTTSTTGTTTTKPTTTTTVPGTTVTTTGPTVTQTTPGSTVTTPGTTVTQTGPTTTTTGPTKTVTTPRTVKKPAKKSVKKPAPKSAPKPKPAKPVLPAPPKTVTEKPSAFPYTL